MTETTSLSLLQSVVDSTDNLTVIFKEEEVILTNSTFNEFFSVKSLEEFSSNFRLFIDIFVLHPSYFNKEKLESDEKWFDAILKLPEMDRVVSMLNMDYEPHAFSVSIDNSNEGYYIITFVDITQDLIKRIMIENNVSIDPKSGAYAQEYFLQVAKSYEEAAIFNKKDIAAITLDITNNDEQELSTFVNQVKNSIRQDDMLVDWRGDKFILMYLLDKGNTTQSMVNKLEILVNTQEMKVFECKISSLIQVEDERINSFISRIESDF